MIKVKYPVSGAALGADVKGLGPNVCVETDVLQRQHYAGPQLS